MDRQDSDRKNNRGKGNDWRKWVRGRQGSDRQDYSKSSFSSTKCPLITFLPFHHLWPSQSCKTVNNTTLTQSTTEPETTLYVGLMTAWSSSSHYQGHRLNALADFGVGLCARPAKIWIWSSQHESWWRRSVRARDKRHGCSCWRLKVSARLILSNTKEKNGSIIWSGVI